MARKTVKTLVLIASLFALPVLADTVGTVSGTTVVMVPATADAHVMQCAVAWTPANSCWPSAPASIGPSAALGSLAGTALVWAISGTATSPKWTPVSSLSIAPAPIPTSTTSTGSVAITWTAPTQNVDGTVLTNLASYNLYRGASPTTLIVLKNMPAAMTSYTDATLTVGTWFYAVSAVNATGQESAQTGPVSVVMTQAPAVTPAAPGAPGGLSVTVTVTVPGK